MTLPFDGYSISAATSAFLMQQHRLLIGGAWVEGVDGETIVTRDPATGLPLTQVATGGAAASMAW